MVVGDPFFDPPQSAGQGNSGQPYQPTPRDDRPKALRPARGRGGPSGRREEAVPAGRGGSTRQPHPQERLPTRSPQPSPNEQRGPATALDWRNERATTTPPRAQHNAEGRARHWRPAHHTPGGTTFREDIEGLRAIAVLLVILYHFRLGPFHGGLVGVDVFFVLSGFLITSLLVRELQQTNTISLPNFWARRVRRLLPASALVIVATLIAGRTLLSPIQLRSVGHDALAAATFVVNIVFGRRTSDYLGAQAADASPSPLLHFWSLALEEQFYVVWPLLVLAASRARDRMRALSSMVFVLGGASLLFCLYLTDRSPIWAFYLLPTRAWELLAGAAVALLGARAVRIPEQLRAVIGWAGIGGIIVAALVIDDRTAFPGYAALLPVLATVAVVGIGAAKTRNGPMLLLRARPLQWVGARSYAIYLWHWPVFILAEAEWGPLSVPQRIGAVAVAGSLATVSYILVEDPIRHLAWLAVQARRSLALGAVLVALGAIAAVITYRSEITTSGAAAERPDLILTDDTVSDPVDSNPEITDPTPGTGSDSAGTSAPDSTSPTSTENLTVYPLDSLLERSDAIVSKALGVEEVPSNLTPNFSNIGKDLPGVYSDGCLLDPGQTESPACVYGDPNSPTRVALVGDSHAAQWFPALEAAAQRRGWRLLVLVKKGCAMANFVTYDENNRERTECVSWRKKVLARLDDEKPTLILTATYRYRLANRPAKSSANQQWLTALTPVLKQLRDRSQKLIFLGDIPHPESWPATCLSKNRSSARDCLIDRSKAERKPVVDAEIAATAEAGGTYVKVSDWMCSLQQCAVMLGNLQLYRDDNHIGATASRYFLPFIEAVTVPLLPN